MIHIGGLQKTSLIDFPGRVSCVVFASGCNYRCPYCHNPQLVKMPGADPSEDALPNFYDFLKRRRGFLDGVVITGGEPTLQPGLPELCKTITKLGFAIKLDTNGSRPDVLETLLDDHLVDYVAMDIKSDPMDYAPLFSENRNPAPVLESIRILGQAKVAIEYRTTCLNPITTPAVIDTIGRLIKGAPLYALQICRTKDVLKPGYFRKHPEQFDRNQIGELKAVAQKWVRRVVVR